MAIALYDALSMMKCTHSLYYYIVYTIDYYLIQFYTRSVLLQCTQIRIVPMFVANNDNILVSTGYDICRLLISNELSKMSNLVDIIAISLIRYYETKDFSFILCVYIIRSKTSLPLDFCPKVNHIQTHRRILSEQF